MKNAQVLEHEPHKGLYILATSKSCISAAKQIS